MCQCANVRPQSRTRPFGMLICRGWLFASEDGIPRIFVGAGHALRLRLFFLKIQPLQGCGLLLYRFLYGCLTPSGSVILVLSA